MNIRGFSLVELVVVIVVIAIIAGIGVASLLTASDALSFLTIRTDLAQSADIALPRMSREIRAIRDDKSIFIATPVVFCFYDGSGNFIGYYLSGTNLMRVRSISPMQQDILSSNVSGLTFTYYDDNGGVLSNPAVGIGTLTDIRSIGITLILQNGGSALPVASQIRPRKLRHVSYKFF